MGKIIFQMSKKVEQLVKDRIYFDEFTDNIKQKIRFANDDTFIVLFVLQVARLEYNLKRFINEDNCVLGTAITKWEEKINKINKDKIKDYRIKSLFKPKYIESFKKCCTEINKLRNNLYHNLFRGKNNDGGLNDVLEKIKSRTEVNPVSYKNEPNFYKELSNEKHGDLVKTTNYRGLVDINAVPKSWTLELLIEASKYYKN